MTDQQKQILQQSREAQRLSVAAVHVPVKLLTDKERSRLKHVNEQLKDGRNPYNETSKSSLGGSNALDRVIPYDPSDRGDDEVRKLEKKWRSGVSELSRKVLLSFSILQPREKPDPEKVECTFCGKQVSRILATNGKGTPRRTVKNEVVTVGGEPTIQTLVYYSQVKTVACPDCALEAKDIEFPTEE